MSGMKKASLPAAAALGVLLAVVLGALLCLPGAALIARGLLPMEGAPLWAAAAAGVGVFIASFCLIRLRGRQAMPTAAAVAGGFLAVAALICALGGERFDFGSWLLRLAVAVFAGGLLAAVMSIRQNPHRKRRR